ncbi:MAG TPA: glycosyltransferase family 2 protein [Methylomirabilota bacterium]|nr:glycosyltransferase family 2 protein [Methylomirabilota bacterium]
MKRQAEVICAPGPANGTPPSGEALAPSRANEDTGCGQAARPVSRSHLVLIPSYNSGPLLRSTVEAALRVWRPVWVVTDGSTDGSGAEVERLATAEPGLRLMTHERNRGKGAAVLSGLRAAAQAGFTHVLVMDADGQHPPGCIAEFMRLSAENPGAMILGVPTFGPEAPRARRWGRRLGNWWTNVETLWGGIGDSLFGFRVYPVTECLRVMESIRAGRRYDFDTVVAVRLFWAGVRPINRPVPVRYLAREEGGVSHFRYVRDNVLLTWTHVVLVLGLLARLRGLWHRAGWNAQRQACSAPGPRHAGSGNVPRM